MIEYSLFVKSSAQKELDALGEPAFGRIDKKILALASNPRPAGSKKLRGYADHWRIRVGDYRVIYVLDEKQRRVDITA